MKKALLLFILLYITSCSNNESDNTKGTNTTVELPQEFSKAADFKKLKITFRCGENIKLPESAIEIKDTSLTKYFIDEKADLNQHQLRKIFLLAGAFKDKNTTLLVWAEIFNENGSPVTNIKMGVYNKGQLRNSVEICSDLGYVSKEGCIENSRSEVVSGEKEREYQIVFRQFVLIDGEENLLMEQYYGQTEDDNEVLGLTGSYLDQEVKEKLSADQEKTVITEKGVGDFILGQKFDKTEMKKKYKFQYSEIMGECDVYCPESKKSCYEIKLIDNIIKVIKVKANNMKTLNGHGIGDNVKNLLAALKMQDMIYVAENKEIHIKFSEYPNMWFITDAREKNEINSSSDEVNPASIMNDQVIQAIIVYDEN